MNYYAIVCGIALIVMIGALVWACYERKKATVRVKYNAEIEEKNAKLADTLQDLLKQEQDVKHTLERDLETLKNVKDATNDTLESQKEIARKAFENYCEVLANEYDARDKEFDAYLESMETAYDQAQDRLIGEIEKEQAELEKIRATRAALIEAQRKEKEIKENKDFYCLIPTENDKDDIRRLERVKHDLHNQRILSMLIWQTFFQKPMTSLCNNVLGAKTVTGIYKITNLNNDMCYIGQAVDVATRWKDHAKCGLGIDTPAGNKLYAAMIEEGIWNFSWELLEACDRSLLNEKEKYYIDLYQSKNFGYNITKGNK